MRFGEESYDTKSSLLSVAGCSQATATKFNVLFESTFDNVVWERPTTHSLEKMGNLNILSELGSLMWSHPYVSCSLLVFLTPPFFPILKFFSPLLISTALFVVALVTMGPQFEAPPDQEDEFLINASEFQSGEEAGSRRDDWERDFNPRKPSKDMRSTWSDWVRSWKESWIMWLERRVLQNENWKGVSLNDDNVSILQEAFAHRAEEEPRAMTKLATRRIPDEERVFEPEPEMRRQADVIPALSHSDSWTSDRSFDRSSSFSKGPSNFFSPHPSFSRRHERDVNPLFDNVIPPPIDYDMPPLITGPASITDPLFKSLEDEMDMSDDEYDHHHSDHEHLEVGETVDAIPHEEIPVATETHHQSAENQASSSDEPRSATPEILPQEPAPASPHVDPVHTRDIDVTQTQEERAPPADDGPLPVAVEERSIPATEIHHEFNPQGETSQPKELHDIPELEDVLPVENEKGFPASLPDEVPATSEAPTHHTSEVLATPSEAISTPSEDLPAPRTDVLVEVSPHFVERSLSLPVHGTGSHEPAPEQAHQDVPPLDTHPQEAAHPTASLSHAISLPVALNPIRPIVLPPKSTDPGPLSPDTELGTVTTFDHGKEAPVTPLTGPGRYDSVVTLSEDEQECQKQLSMKEKVLNLEALSAAVASTKPAPNTTLQPATTDELVTHVAEKVKSFVDTPPKKFEPGAPQLQITPPSSKVVLTASSPAKHFGASLHPPPSSSKSVYSSSEEESEDEQIDLDSDVEDGGEDSDSDHDVPPLVKSGTKVKAPLKPALDQQHPAPTAVQG